MPNSKREIRVVSRPSCFLCGKEGQALYQGLVDPFFDAPGVWNFKQCVRPVCGLIWLDPAPVPEDLHLAYEKYFTHGEGDGKSSVAARVRTLLYSFYRVTAAVPGTITGLQRARREVEKMFLGDSKPGRLLDVGCGDGLFLNRMRKLGWSVEGLDFDARAIENAKARFDLNLSHGDLHRTALPAGHFDAVTLSHVIEHVPDPIKLLKEVRRILKTGGQMVLTTPNNGSVGHRTFGSHWFGVDAPRHLQVFSLNSLREVALRAGFQKVRTFSTAANADIFIGSSYSIRDSLDHRTSDQPAPNLIRTWKAITAQFREHSALRGDPGCGEEAVMACQ